ncbi:hypothetical protein GGR50DRAFT_158342 [Xylaria sp. CBS 124048]|nr:hypothetical protein GGR50DRAFT_158342 [Xylaria sp. CBS 124048]
MFSFRRPKDQHGIYERITLKDESEADSSQKSTAAPSEDKDTEETTKPAITTTAGFYRQLVIILAGANVLLSFATVWLAIVFVKRGASYALVKSDVEYIGPAEIPVEMQSYRFQTGVRESTPFFGPPNATTDAAWGTILNAGLIKLTPAQADTLSAPTAVNQDDPTTYVGILEVFHQLHCLNLLRLRAFATDEEKQFADPGHTEHCFEYIRQSLMCLADVNIAPISFNERKREYAIHWDATRQCRNFEKIHAWARDEAHMVSEDVM